MNKDMLKEITAVCAKYPTDANDTLFLMLYNGKDDTFTGTPVHGAIFAGKYDIRTDM